MFKRPEKQLFGTPESLRCQYLRVEKFRFHKA